MHIGPRQSAGPRGAPAGAPGAPAPGPVSPSAGASGRTPESPGSRLARPRREGCARRCRAPGGIRPPGCRAREGPLSRRGHDPQRPARPRGPGRASARDARKGTSEPVACLYRVSLRPGLSRVSASSSGGESSHVTSRRVRMANARTHHHDAHGSYTALCARPYTYHHRARGPAQRYEPSATYECAQLEV
jgi:hypothetical protein